MIGFFAKYSALLITVVYFTLFIAHLVVFIYNHYINKFTLVRGIMLLTVSIFYCVIWFGKIEISVLVSGQVSRLIWLIFGLLFTAELIDDGRKNGC